MQNRPNPPVQHAPRLVAGVLAGDRGGPSEIARAEGVARKVLVDIDGTPMLQRVLDVVAAAATNGPVYVCGPDADTVAATPWLAQRIETGALSWVAPGASPARGAAALVDAAFATPLPPDGLLLTTGDHPLLHAETVERFVADAWATGADAVVGLARHAAVQAAFPDGRRTALRLADGPFCGCNLFLIRSARGRAVLDFWRAMEQQRKRPLRMAAKLGLGVVLRYLSGRLRLDWALERLSAITGVTVAAVDVADPDAAVDVDSLADLALVRARWQARRTALEGVS